MAPDVEELIKKVNTLTLDKNRLKQKLTQLTNEHAGKDILNRPSLSRMSASSLSQEHQFQQQHSSTKDSFSSSNNSAWIPNKSLFDEDFSIFDGPKSPATAPARQQRTANNQSANIISGVECATSCEEDMLYMNELYRKRIDEYDEHWQYLQSKCSALLSELNALQKNYARLKRDHLELEEKFRSKCDDYDAICSKTT